MTTYYSDEESVFLHGDVIEQLKTIPDGHVQCVVTSPPYYGLRNYGVDGQIGAESSPGEYVAKIVSVFDEVWRVLRNDGTVWLNLGDTYAANRGYQVPSTKGGAKHSPAQGEQTANKVPEGLKAKDLIGIPWRCALALQAAGWWLRNDIIWEKPNCMPESVKDRLTRSHEYLFLLTKNEHYSFDSSAIKEPSLSPVRKREKNNGESAVDTKLRGHGSHCGTGGDTRNRRTVWNIPTQSYAGAHFATFPEKLVEPCILAGSLPIQMVLDPFCGSGTTGKVALESGRKFIGIDLNSSYLDLALTRCSKTKSDIILTTNLVQEGTPTT